MTPGNSHQQRSIGQVECLLLTQVRWIDLEQNTATVGCRYVEGVFARCPPESAVTVGDAGLVGVPRRTADAPRSQIDSDEVINLAV